MFVVAGSIGFLFALGVGIYILKNARELSESTYRASGEDPRTWFSFAGLSHYRNLGVWFCGI